MVATVHLRAAIMALLTMAAQVVMVSRAVHLMGAVMVLKAVTAHRAAAAITDIPAHLPAARKANPGKEVTAAAQKWVLAMEDLIMVAPADTVHRAVHLTAAITDIPALLRAAHKASRGKVATAAARA